jgi:aldehyde dehydrogenase (NAD+)
MNNIKSNYIGGEWVKGSATTPNVNPSDLDDIIAEYTRGSADDVGNAIAAAGEAFPCWRKTTIQARSDLLDKIGTNILARREELGRLLSREEGKTLPEGIGEVTRAGQIFKFFAGEALRLGGELQPSVRPDVTVEISREPIGVVGLITPWNFPMAIPAWKLAPALACGNCVVLKPAELVPGCAHALAQIIDEAGMPPGVFNLVMGRGSDVGARLVKDPGVAAISFTGSQSTGAGINIECASRMARVQLEMGGKNPLVVVDDADLDVAVNCAIQSAYYSTGQRCTASSRLVVTDGIHDRFVAAVTARLKALCVGHALEQGTDIGPVADDKQLRQNQDYIEIGLKEGALLATGGDILERPTRGYYFSPALFTETRPDMRINREEIFGPIASVQRVKDYEEALAVANDTIFGLSSGICTTSLKHARHYRANARAGMVMVNLPTAGVDYHVPFGGSKASSYGPREQGSHAREFYTMIKTSYIEG